MEQITVGRIADIRRYDPPVVAFTVVNDSATYAARVAYYPLIGSEVHGSSLTSTLMRGVGECVLIEDAVLVPPSDLFLHLCDLCAAALPYLPALFADLSEDQIEAIAGVASVLSGYMPSKVAQTLARKWLKGAETRGNFRRLRWYGLSRREAVERGRQRLPDNAYLLSAPTQRVDDVHFAGRTDAMRYASLLVDAVRDAERNGCTAISVSDALSHAARHALTTDWRSAYACAVDEGLLLSSAGFLARPERVDAELGIVRHADRLSQVPLPPLPLPARERFGTIDDYQWNALTQIVQSGFVLIVGPGGSGKTRVIRDIVRMTGSNVMLAAPTNRAARRLADVTGMPATTLHRLLRSTFVADINDYVFDRCEPMGPRVLVVDEARLVAPSVLYALLRLVEQGTRVVLLGDIAQLPAVEAGDAFADLVRMGRWPTCYLQGNHRSGDGLAELGAAIRQGYVPEARDWTLVPFLVPDGVVAEYARHLNEGYKPQDTLVLAPTKGGPLGVTELNRILAPLGNPLRQRWFDVEYLSGDRLIATKHEEGSDIATGDLFTVLDCRANIVVLQRDDSEVFERRADDMERFASAWAMSVYASQGHEYPATIFALGPSRLAHRETCYTAATRPRRSLSVVTHPPIFEGAVQNVAPVRTTIMRTFIAA